MTTTNPTTETTPLLNNLLVEPDSTTVASSTSTGESADSISTSQWQGLKVSLVKQRLNDAIHSPTPWADMSTTQKVKTVALHALVPICYGGLIETVGLIACNQWGQDGEFSTCAGIVSAVVPLIVMGSIMEWCPISQCFVKLFRSNKNSRVKQIRDQVLAYEANDNVLHPKHIVKINPYLTDNDRSLMNLPQTLAFLELRPDHSHVLSLPQQKAIEALEAIAKQPSNIDVLRMIQDKSFADLVTRFPSFLENFIQRLDDNFLQQEVICYKLTEYLRKQLEFNRFSDKNASEAFALIKKGYPLDEVQDVLKAVIALDGITEDVNFLVGEKKIPADRQLILKGCPGSSYFIQLLKGSFSESEKQKIPILGIDPAIFRDVITFAMTGHLARTNADYLQLIIASRYFQTPGLREYCMNYYRKHRQDFSFESVENLLGREDLEAKDRNDLLEILIPQTPHSLNQVLVEDSD